LHRGRTKHHEHGGRRNPNPPDAERLARNGCIAATLRAKFPRAFRSRSIGRRIGFPELSGYRKRFVFANGNGIGCGTGYNGGQLLRTMATKEYLG
jgi:hypothetical protein